MVIFAIAENAMIPGKLCDRTASTRISTFEKAANYLEKIGAPNKIRTCGLCLRRAALYPAELWMHLCSSRPSTVPVQPKIPKVPRFSVGRSPTAQGNRLKVIEWFW